MRVNNLLNLNFGYKSSAKKTDSASQNQNYPRSTNFEGYKLLRTFIDPNHGVRSFIYELDNKHRVIIIPKRSLKTVTVDTVVKTGAFNDPPNKRGMSHLIEHVLFYGSKGMRPGQYDQIMEENGAMITASTSTDATSFAFSIANPSKAKLRTLIKALAALVQHPTMPPGKFKREQKVVTQEALQYKDDPFDVQANISLRNTFQIDHVGDSDITLGSPSDIKHIKRNEALDYHSDNYRPENMKTIVVGNVLSKGDTSPDALMRLIDNEFGKPFTKPVKNPRHYQPLEPLRETVVSFNTDPKVKNTRIQVNYVGPKNSSNREAVAAEALLYALAMDNTSRFSKKLLEIGAECLTMINVTGNHYSNRKVLGFNISKIKPGEEQRVLDYLKESIEELKSSPITEDELRRIKLRLINEFNLISQTSTELAEMVEATAMTYGTQAYEKYVEYINRLTTKDLNQAATQYLIAKKASISVFQSPKTQNRNVSFQGKLISPKHIKGYQLPNGIKLTINDNPNFIRSAISFSINSNASAKPGVAYVLCQMLQNATARRTAEQLAMAKSNIALIDSTISPTSSGIELSISNLNEQFLESVKIAKEMLFEPCFTEANFQRAKRDCLLENQEILLDAEDRAFETMYRGELEGTTPRLLSKVIDGVTLKNVEKLYKELFQNPEAVVAITGPIRKINGLREAIIEELQNIGRKFNKQKFKQKDFSTPKTNRIAVQLQKGLKQSHIVQFFHITPESIEDFAALEVLNGILGFGGFYSKLFQSLREKQELAYQVSSRFNILGAYAQGKLFIKTGIEDERGRINNNIEESIRGFQKEIKKLITESPSREDVETTKRVLTTYYIDKNENANEQNETIAISLKTKYGPLFYNKLLDAVMKVTPRDVKRVAQKYLTQPSVISGYTTGEAFKKAEAFLKAQGGRFRLYTEEEI